MKGFGLRSICASLSISEPSVVMLRVQMIGYPVLDVWLYWLSRMAQTFGIDNRLSSSIQISTGGNNQLAKRVGYCIVTNRLL